MLGRWRTCVTPNFGALYMASSWSVSGAAGDAPAPAAGSVPAPLSLIWVQAALSAGSLTVWFLDSQLLRIVGWFVAVIGALCGVGYRFRYRQLSIRPEFRGLSAGSGATALFRFAFVLSLLAIVVTSVRASLVIPQ